MITEVVMPQMGADMKEGTIISWRKSEGDQVNRGDIIAEIETDKANIEIEAFGSGVLRKTLHQDGETVPVATIIAVIAAPDDDISSYEAGAPSSAPPQASASEPPPQTEPQAQVDAGTQAAAPTPSAPPPPAPAPAAAAPAGADGRLRASPVAKRLAEEFNVDLSSVEGTGPDGRIVRRDVEAAREAPAPQASIPTATAPRAISQGEDLVEKVPLSRIRQTVARRMQASKQTAPHYYLGVDVDMTEALAMRGALNKALGTARGRLTINDVIVLATAKTLLQHPKFNAFWAEDHIERHRQVNVGIAVALDDGLVAPAILDAANKGLEQISIEARDVATRARSGTLKPDEYTAATFNVSNVGGFGTDFILAIITPPQVGVLGIGAVKEAPVVLNGQIVIRQMMKVTLAADHRATDGADGARFLETLRKILETPAMMVL